MRAIYFVHDLNDAAVARRVRMLRSGGIGLIVAGFWRGRAPALEIDSAPAVPLRRTYDAHLLHRAISSIGAAIQARDLSRKLGQAEVLIARNLEMLAIATAVGRASGGKAALVYEALDLHRLLLARGPAGAIFRKAERKLLGGTDLVITSSPAFARQYFEPLQFRRSDIPIAIVENKLLLPAAPEGCELQEQNPGPPWRIGWFGMIRCRRSFEMLSRAARRRPDLLHVLIAGRPSPAVFPDFDRMVRRSQGLTFLGPYNINHIGELYRRVHFNWAIDYFEENANSEWLLPNRIYEGGCHNSVPLALSRTETGRWLAAKGLGVTMMDPAQQLEPFLEHLTGERYQKMKAAAQTVPRSAFVAGAEDCARLASLLREAIERHRCAAVPNEGRRRVCAEIVSN